MSYNVAYALNEVRDEYILDAAMPRKAFAHWVLPMAACLCLVAGALGLYFMDDGRPPLSLEQPIGNTTQSNTQATVPETTAPPPTGSTIWGSGGHSGIGRFETPELGGVWFCECLKEVMEHSTNPQDVFAVNILGFSGMDAVDDAVLYREIVLPLGAEEDFLENRIVFLTQEQIKNLKCPESMGLALHVDTLPDVTLCRGGKALVSEAYFQELEEETMTVLIEFDSSYEVDCKREERPNCGFSEKKTAFLKDYGIPEENCEYWVHYTSDHTVILRDVEKETVYSMLEDSRIYWIEHIRWREGYHTGIG